MASDLAGLIGLSGQAYPTADTSAIRSVGWRPTRSAGIPAGSHTRTVPAAPLWPTIRNGLPAGTSASRRGQVKEETGSPFRGYRSPRLPASVQCSSRLVTNSRPKTSTVLIRTPALSGTPAKLPKASVALVAVGGVSCQILNSRTFICHAQISTPWEYCPPGIVQARFTLALPWSRAGQGRTVDRRGD